MRNRFRFTRLIPCLATFVGWSFFVAATLAGAQPFVIVSSDFSDSVPMYDLSGNFIRNFVGPGGGGLDSPQGITVGPDGNVYVSSAVNDKVLKYDGLTGAFMGAFVDGGLLDRPWYLTFGPDGNLYVSSSANNRVLCYDGTTGAFLRVAAQDFFLGAPDGISFAADGTMLVSKFPAGDSRVMRFNPQTGAFIANVVDEPGLVGALEHRLSPDGTRLFVSSFGTNQVREYDVATGAFIRNFIGGPPLAGPVGQLVLPDGTLLVSSWNNDSIFRYDADTGALLGTFAQGGPLDNPNNMAILNVPEPAGALPVLLCLACGAGHRPRSARMRRTPSSRGRCEGQTYEQMPHSMHAPTP